MTDHIDFAFDIVSPYSYLAYNIMERYRARWDVTVRYVPAFLGGVFAATRNSPPATLPARAPYLVRDLGRCGAFYDVDVMLPPNFPSKTVRALRALTALQLDDDADFDRALRALFERYWAKGEAWNDSEEELIQALTAAGLATEKVAHIAARSTDDDVKEQLKTSTANVVDRGAFGFPAIFARKEGQDQSEEEMYFGADRFAVMAHAFGFKWEGPTP